MSEVELAGGAEAVLRSMAGLVGGLALMLVCLQRRLVFRPSGRILPAPHAPLRTCYAVEAPAPTGKLRGWWLTRESEGARRLGGRRCFVFFGGGNGNISHDFVSLEFLASLGTDVLSLDYPGYGRSDGVPSEKGFHATADVAWQYVTEELGVPPDRVVVVGRSLGCAVAVKLAGRRSVRGLVLHSAFPSLPEIAARHYRVLPAVLVRPFCLSPFDARAEISRLRCPMLFVHARQDRHIPLELGQRCYRMVQAPKRFIEVPGGHDGPSWTRVGQVMSGLRDLWGGWGERAA